MKNLWIKKNSSNTSKLMFNFKFLINFLIFIQKKKKKKKKKNK